MLAIGGGLWLSNAVALSAGLMVLSIVLAVWSPVGSFWAACAAIPLVYHPVELGSARVSLLELGLIVTVVGIATRVLSEEPLSVFKEWVAAGEDHWVWIGALLLLLAGVISLLFQPDHEHLREGIRTYRWVVIEAIAAFIAAIASITTQR